LYDSSDNDDLVLSSNEFELIVDEYINFNGSHFVPNPNDKSFYAFRLDRDLDYYNTYDEWDIVNYYSNLYDGDVETGDYELNLTVYDKLGQTIITGVENSVAILKGITIPLRATTWLYRSILSFDLDTTNSYQFEFGDDYDLLFYKDGTIPYADLNDDGVIDDYEYELQGGV
jgi:hypothetical protein